MERGSSRAEELEPAAWMNYTGQITLLQRVPDGTPENKRWRSDMAANMMENRRGAEKNPQMNEKATAACAV